MGSGTCKTRMGKKKSKRKPPTKRKAIEPLDTQFNCPFCNHEKSCEVKIDKTRIRDASRVGFASKIFRPPSTFCRKRSTSTMIGSMLARLLIEKIHYEKLQCISSSVFS